MDLRVFHWIRPEPFGYFIGRFELHSTTTEMDTIATADKLCEESAILGGIVVPVRDRANPDLEAENWEILFFLHCYIRH